ncbi:hypothetical protein [Oharaeibacter diazotrophicus]|uniref:Uncharacterized protein n=1 Tax=Oharaeibacter diazotrophicus TaxID=1920512 RepID=A0A4R6RMI8_9HYPH|nr:hypothetical protein [Oharaeibacter diazotrophicus]TDP87385.1 hypothetical protein EDD54_1279 [Oharaeibacter diazotrophicus]GLS77418.1 hypothetical protein GCM10007904_27550 [Oharaeibacter diazotrophicus]
MDSESFVDLVKIHVADAAVLDVVERLRNPTGRKVSVEIRNRSNWYKSLDDESRDHVDSLIAESACEALFGLFVVLDGDRLIDESGGYFELAHVSGRRVILCNSDTSPLHDMFRASIQDCLLF